MAFVSVVLVQYSFLWFGLVMFVFWSCCATGLVGLWYSCGLGDCRPRLSLVLRAPAVGSDCTRMSLVSFGWFGWFYAGVAVIFGFG